MRNGENAASAVATSAARRPTVRTPTRYTSGIAAAPASSDGARSSAGVSPIWVVSHARTKYSGGVISASVCTTDTASARLRPATTECVDSSSANRLCCATIHRSATPAAVSAATVRTERARIGAPPYPSGCEDSAGEDHR